MGEQNIKAGGAYAEIGVRMSAFEKGLASAQARFNSWASGLRQTGTRLIAVGVAISAPMVAALHTFATYGDNVAKMARRTGLTTEAVSELGFAAELSGTSMEALEKGVRGMQRSMFDAKRGSTEIVDSLSELGLTFEALRGLNPEEQFLRIAERIQAIEDPGLKAALALKLLGKTGADLIPLMDSNGKGLRAMTQEARVLGRVLDERTAGAAERLTDQLSRASSSVMGLKIRIAAALEPAVSRMASLFVHAMVRVQSFVSANEKLILTIAKIGAALIAAGTAFVAISAALTGVAVAIGIIKTLIATLPIVALIGGLAAFAASIALLTDTLMGLFGMANMGFANFLGNIKIGGASINAWMQAAWIQVFEGWEIVKSALLGSWGNFAKNIQDLGSVIYQGMAQAAQWIFDAFWGVLRKIADSFHWLADKILIGSYELHLIDDDELRRAGETIDALKGKFAGFSEGMKGTGSAFFQGEISASQEAQRKRDVDYAKEKLARAAELRAEMGKLGAAMNTVFAEDLKTGDSLEPFKNKVGEILEKFAELVNRAKALATLPEIEAFKKGGGGPGGAGALSVAGPSQTLASFSGYSRFGQMSPVVEGLKRVERAVNDGARRQEAAIEKQQFIWSN